MLNSSRAEEKHAPAKVFTTDLEEVDELKVQFSALINQNATEKAAPEEAVAQIAANARAVEAATLHRKLLRQELLKKLMLKSLKKKKQSSRQLMKKL